MTADSYLRRLLASYAVNRDGAEAAGQSIYPLLESWGKEYLVRAAFSGSLAKGTGVSISTDADIFLSLSSATPGTLAEIYHSLYDAVTVAGYAASKQNVSIGVTVGGYSIDLVPGRRQSQYGNDHSLYRSRANTWTKTNVDTHIGYVTGSGREDEIRILKLWRTRHTLNFPSFYLELATIDALHYARHGEVAANVCRVLEHLRDNITSSTYIDPANTNNIVSEDCTALEKMTIALQARESLLKRTWEEVVW
jgi:tRNA nucleotidyltransferase (CCA-adding enzyme)